MMLREIEHVGISLVAAWCQHTLGERIVTMHYREDSFEIDIVTSAKNNQRYHEVRTITTKRCIEEVYGVLKLLTLLRFCKRHCWPRCTLHLVVIDSKTNKAEHTHCSLYSLLW